METKICSCCKLEKSILEFPKCSRNKDGLDIHCKECRNAKNKKYRDTHKDLVKASRKKYYEDHKETILAQKKVYSDAHKEEKATYDKEYRQLNKEKLREQKRIWERTNLKHKLVSNLRRRVLHALNGESKSDHTLNLIGCSIDELKIYLEEKFTEGMSWDNYGQWHIDHIRPCCSFDLSDPEQQKECFNYKNLLPLWAIDNLKKAYKYENLKSFE